LYSVAGLIFQLAAAPVYGFHQILYFKSKTGQNVNVHSWLAETRRCMMLYDYIILLEIYYSYSYCRSTPTPGPYTTTRPSTRTLWVTNQKDSSTLSDSCCLNSTAPGRSELCARTSERVSSALC